MSKFQPRCFDTLHADRCERDLGHDGAHRKGVHVWATRNVPTPPWRAHLTSRDDTRAVLEGAPL